MDPQARLGADVTIGPYALVGSGTVIGDRSRVMAHAQVMPDTTLGADCQVFQGAAIGGPPQHIDFEEHETKVTVGDGTVIREYVTVNRGMRESGTIIGSQAYLMAYVHVGHDCRIGDRVILANGVQLGGFVQIDEYASVGGMTPVHQQCHVGAHAFIGGGFRVVQDVPPYILATGEPLGFSGLNVIGLRRRNIPPEVRAQIKRAYQLIYRSEHNPRQAAEVIRREMDLIPEIQTILAFIENSTRGLI